MDSRGLAIGQAQNFSYFKLFLSPLYRKCYSLMTLRTFYQEGKAWGEVK